MEEHFIPGTSGKIFADRKRFSFSIDSILLTDFCNLKKEKTLIDIGSGTGIIGFRLNYLNNIKKLYLIEIQKEMSELIEKTIEKNKLENVELVNDDLRNLTDYFEKSSIDYIVSNPPYKKIGTGILNENENFLISRYEYKLKLEDILDFSYRVLKSNGKVFLIYSIERLVDVISESRIRKLEPKRIRFISSNSNTKPHLFMIELVKNGRSNLLVEDNLYIYDKNGEYTDEIKEIYYGKEI